MFQTGLTERHVSPPLQKFCPADAEQPSGLLEDEKRGASVALHTCGLRGSVAAA